MASDETERLLSDIGQLLAEETGHPLGGILLHAQLDTNVVEIAVFIERGNHVDYDRSGDSLMYPLINLWEQEEPGKRWAEMEFLLRNGKFTTTFIYPDELDPDEGLVEFGRRRDRIVARYFGDKPIVYPPWPPSHDVQQFDL